MSRKSDLEKDVEIGLENIVEEIRKVSQMGKAINNSKLTKRAVVILLSDMSGRALKRSDIEVILHNLPLLEREFLK